ncbi:MAG: hypothetical protein ABJB16_14315, partial [Saprospiraceae bacterium]
MYRNVFIFLFLIGFNHVLNAQAFDTLLVQYQNISQIYPLADGSFILIGQGEESIVERIDSTGKSIWSVSMGLNYNDDDVLDDYAVHLTAQDSTIQIAVATKHCDYYDTTDVKVFTLNFDGLILDSLLVRARDFPLYITLLSGNPQYPRIAYAIDKYLVLLYADGDTSQLHVITPGLDSTIGDLDGPPVCAALSPEGTLLVGTRNGSLFRFKDDGTGYQFYIVRHFAFHSSGDFGLQKLFCLDEDYYILVYFNEISIYSVACCWHKSFFKSDGIFYEVKFISPNLQVMTDDSFYILDHFLDKIYAGPMPEYEQHISGFALRNQNLFTVGSGYFYREGGFLGSENLITHSGQKFYDIELVDFEVGPYDSVYFQNGRRYMYTIPNASV